MQGCVIALGYNGPESLSLSLTLSRSSLSPLGFLLIKLLPVSLPSHAPLSHGMSPSLARRLPLKKTLLCLTSARLKNYSKGIDCR